MARTRIVEKKNRIGSNAPLPGGGGDKNGDELLDQEVHKAIQRELGLLKKQLTLEPIQDNTEKQVRLVIAILRMNISALRGTIIHDSGPAVAAERKAAVDRLVQITNAFDTKKHTPESINEDARNALNELSDTFKVFGPSWISIRDSIVQLALEQIEDIKAKDPLHKEKEELEKLEKRARKIQEKELTERKEREKAEKEKKKKKKKNKKNTTTTNDEPYDDFGDERVPPQPACEHLTCRCRHEQEYYSHSLADSDDVADESTDLQSHDYSNRSRSTSSTFSSDDQPVLSHVMSPEYWSQFCYFYDQGSK
ncbi:hypothetical protein PMAYCL1PPCAC_02783 [Pristionchus mayeri]|uniref:Uncharacterized protein n=1 Tax=Pristionchus mayeri TaxID=1317129 RepID=A0AAN4Z1Z8_9BILA|nr:hypothetical protein PMAYCL1PPCAC_02783 [Pristionchus mayeri]